MKTNIWLTCGSDLFLFHLSIYCSLHTKACHLRRKRRLQISYLYKAGAPLVLLSLFDQVLRKSLEMTLSDMFLILLSPGVSSLQFSTRQVFTEGTTTAALLSPTAGAHPSCVAAVERCVVGRWCASRTHTSTFTASPAKVVKNPYHTPPLWIFTDTLLPSPLHALTSSLSFKFIYFSVSD